MNRPDSGSADQSANQDDAVWLDLVARLEGKPASAGTPTAAATDAGSTPNAVPDSTGHHVPTPDATEPGTAKDASVGPATFRDFDPLGLAGTAPTELSAAERGTATPGSGDAGRTATPGPRDYDVEDDDGEFVPEEPPSLAGTDPLTMLAWLGAIGAPVALLLAVMFWRSAPLLAIVGMVTVFILAVVYLIMKLPQEKDENDDGARV